MNGAAVNPVFGWEQCPAQHPTTGNLCVLPAGHEGDGHEAMGVVRMQKFGPHLTSSPEPEPHDPCLSVQCVRCYPPEGADHA